MRLPLQVASNPDERELPDWARKALHQKLDELLDMYVAGHPLWIKGSNSIVSTRTQGVTCDIYLKEWV